MASASVREIRREASERAILDAALALFAELGYEQASIRKIAARVGYSPAAIYRYFASKEEIFLTLAEEALRALSAGDSGNEPTSDAVQDVKATMWRIYEFSKEQPNLFALVFVERHVPSARGDRFRFFGEIWQKLEARIQRCIDEKKFPASIDPYVALRLLSAPVFAIAAQRISNRVSENEDTDSVVHDAIDVTIAGICSGIPIRSRAPEQHPHD